MDVSVRALRDYTRRVDAELALSQRVHAHAREAQQLGIAAEAWTALRAANLDLALMREAHRAVTGESTASRRADRDGVWTIAGARPGHLRSQPQTYRFGDRVEPAWDHVTLKQRLASAVRDARRLELAVARAAATIHAITRAQPFLGDNERVAMVLAAQVLRADGLPAPRVGALERDEAFAAAVFAATDDDRSAIEAYLIRAMWDEALAFASWLAPAQPTTTARWTLRDEHEAAQALRQKARTFAASELDAILEDTTRAVRPALAAVLDLATADPTVIHTSSLGAAVSALGRGQPLCPHAPMRELRWRVEPSTELELVIVAGAPGRGLTGAVAVHVALELPGVPLRAPAPAALCVPDEPVIDRRARLEAWGPHAARKALAASPLAVTPHR
jgi:hypothetical protein